MFIDNGSPVNVIAGRLRGRFGTVSKIRIVSGTGAVVVFVELFEPETGDFPVHLFEPHELERRRFNEGEVIHLIGMQQDAAAYAQRQQEFNERKVA